LFSGFETRIICADILMSSALERPFYMAQNYVCFSCSRWHSRLVFQSLLNRSNSGFEGFLHVKEEFCTTHTVVLPGPVIAFHLSKLHMTSSTCYLEVNSTVESYSDHRDMKNHHIRGWEKSWGTLHKSNTVINLSRPGAMD